MSEYTEAAKDKQIGYYIVAVVVLVISTIGFAVANSNANEEKAQLQSQVDDLTSQNDDLQSNLDDANANIDQANDSITTAQGYAWSDYDSMGQALDNMSTVDNVNN